MKMYMAQGVADSNGRAMAELTPPPGYVWTVRHIGVTSTSTAQSTATVTLNNRFVCGTSSGNQDSADGSPVPVHSADRIMFHWDNAAVGAVCNVQIIVDEYSIKDYQSLNVAGLASVSPFGH